MKNILERTVIHEAATEDGNKSITLYRSYKNFQTWYDIEIDRWIDNKIATQKRDCLDVDSAFEIFERNVKNYKMKVLK